MDKTKIEKFASLGVENIEAQISAGKQEILEIFQGNPKLWFTQPKLVIGTGRSNPWINKCLHALVESGAVERKKGGALYFYRLRQAKTTQ